MIPKIMITTRETEDQAVGRPLAIMSAMDIRIFIHQLTDALFQIVDLEKGGAEKTNAMIYVP